MVRYRRYAMTLFTKLTIVTVMLFIPGAIQTWMLARAENRQFGTPQDSEGTRIFNATEHPYYSSAFHISGGRATLVGSMQDVSPWDHLDYAGKHLLPVKGSVEIQVDETKNT